jgi:hypothetical protein
MTSTPQSSLPQTFLGRLRFPWLFAIFAGLLLFDLVAIDPIPWIDEIMLAVMTTMFGMIKQRRASPAKDSGGRPAEKNVTPPEGSP